MVQQLRGEMRRHWRNTEFTREIIVRPPSLSYEKTLWRAKRLGDIVFNIDRFGLVILGDLLQALLLLRIGGRLGLTLGACAFVTKIISGSVDISCHPGRTNGRPKWFQLPVAPADTAATNSASRSAFRATNVQRSQSSVLDLSSSVRVTITGLVGKSAHGKHRGKAAIGTAMFTALDGHVKIKMSGRTRGQGGIRWNSDAKSGRFYRHGQRP
jgi:hypothetical protein